MSHLSQPLLMSQLENLLERVRLKSLGIKNPGSRLSADQTLFFSGASSWVPWDDVVLIFMDHKLKDWQLPGPPVCKGLHHLKKRNMQISVRPLFLMFSFDIN